MVDELELLRQDWQKQEKALPHFTKAELYPMLLKKSSSLVKWILIVSVLEFGLWIFLTFGLTTNGEEATITRDAIGSTVETVSIIVHLGALLFFMGWFFTNYRKIQNTDSPAVLMRNIMKTRNTVKYYIWFNIIFLIVGTIGAFILVEMNAPESVTSGSLLIATATLALILGILIGIFILFYKLLYGRMLKRLKNNYEELKKLEV